MKTYKNYDFHKKIKLLQIMQISNIFSTNKLYYFIFLTKRPLFLIYKTFIYFINDYILGFLLS